MAEGDRVPVDVVQVPLLSDDHARTTAQHQPDDGPGRGRWLIGAAIAFIVVAGLWFAFDDGSGETTEGPAPTGPSTEPAGATLPSPEPATTTTIVAPAVAVVPGVTVPAYPRVVDVGLGSLSQYDIAAAVDRLDADLDRRSTTRIEIHPTGVVSDIAVERDATNGRYRVDLQTGPWAQTVLVDVPDGRVVITRPGADDLDLDLEQFLAGVRLEGSSPRDFFDALLVGPVRPDTFQTIGTRGRALVTVGDVRVAREYLTVVAGTAVPSWRPHALGPVDGLDVADPPPLLEYRVYVDSTGRIAQVNGVGVFGDSAQLITHRLERPDTAITIEMPPPG